jgi:hypothetical protein
MNNLKIRELHAKIIKGIELSYQRLLETKEKENGDLVISRNGKIIKVKAKDLKK